MKTKLNWSTIAAIVGTIVGCLGLLYGFGKDKELKIIQERANAPHFVVRKLKIDAFGASYPEGKPSYYDYREKSASLNDRLFEMEVFEEKIPQNYPDNRPVGVILRNEGCSIRFFELFCSVPHVFEESEWNKNEYEFRFLLKKDQIGKGLRFSLWYETSNGFQGKQIWELKRGTKHITRIKPRSNEK